MKKLLRFFYRRRPLRPKHATFWPVSKLLNFLNSWFSLEDLSLKQLSLKTLALMEIFSSDRGKTSHLAGLNNITLEDKGV